METKTTMSAQEENALIVKSNISSLERIAMIAGGSYLLYKALSQKDRSIGQMTAGASMLIRGISGYCPLYDAIEHLKKERDVENGIKSRN